MLFTQAQVRELVGIGEETFRAWRKALPPLHGKLGHTPNFTAGDVLALAAVEWMVRTLGIKVGHLNSSAQSLFYACELALDPALDVCYISVEEGNAKTIMTDQKTKIEKGAVLISVKMLVGVFRSSMNNTSTNAQGSLPFS